MMYLEMTRDQTHGGGEWRFPRCVWAPAEKERGGQWPFWTNVLRIREGENLLHLRGVPPKSAFVGWSVARSNGFETAERPPRPGRWGYAKIFYRAELGQYTAFQDPIDLHTVFQRRRVVLETYLAQNKARGTDRLNVFYVLQSGRLQCLNGAYLSHVDEDLLTALFGDGNLPERDAIMSVATAEQMREVRSRVGQAAFATLVKKCYHNRCCFPGCEVSDPRFLVAAHIARWSDNEALRGNAANGLCFCVMHDRAFEVGIFTLDKNFEIVLNPKELAAETGIDEILRPFVGKSIRIGEVEPSREALIEHSMRAGIDL